MKKLISISLVLCFVAILFSVPSFGAENIIQPPKDLRSLFDKKITLQDDFGSSTFFCRVTGISEYLASMGKQVVLSVIGLNYHGEQINEIFYEISSDGENWYIIHQGKKQKIHIISIE